MSSLIEDLKMWGHNSPSLKMERIYKQSKDQQKRIDTLEAKVEEILRINKIKIVI